MSVENLSMQNFSHLVKGKPYKIRGGMKRVGNAMENSPYLEKGERYAKVASDH